MRRRVRTRIAIVFVLLFSLQSMAAQALQVAREAEAVGCCERNCRHATPDVDAARCCEVSPALDSHPGSARAGDAPPTLVLPVRTEPVATGSRPALAAGPASTRRSRSSPVYLLTRSLRI